MRKVVLRLNRICCIRTFSHETKDKNTVTIDTIFTEWHKQQILNSKKLQSAKAVFRPDRADYTQDREAAVLVPMCHVNGQPSFLFMQRSIHLKSHSGEICFPGGMRDPGDPDLIFTALRETFEEIGLPQEQVDVWGTLPSSPSSMRGNFVTPVLGYCGEVNASKLTLNHDEVETVFTETVTTLCDPANHRQTQMRSITKSTPKGYTMPVFTAQHRIWGLTAIILHQVLGAIAPGLYSHKLKHRS